MKTIPRFGLAAASAIAGLHALVACSVGSSTPLPPSSAPVTASTAAPRHANVAVRSAAAPLYTHAAIATDHPVASAAGAEILRAGGNAVDAAVAASFCLSVVRPYSCGIGGGGFMVVYEPPGAPGSTGHAVAINYRETAPAAVGPAYFVDLDEPGASRTGPHAVGVPGTVAGLLEALQGFGTLDRSTVMEPAIRAAEEGFEADASFVRAMNTLRERLDEQPEPEAAFLWRQLCHDGTLEVGDLITNAPQARALRLIAQNGMGAFYRGEIADAIVEVMERRGGAVTRADLAAYAPRITEPLIGVFGDAEVLTMPPPSSGGIAMQQILGIMERRGFAPGSPHVPASPTDPDYVHVTVEAMKHAFADRAEWLADPAFVDVPTQRLLDPAYLDELARSIRPDRTLDAFAYGSVTPAPEDGGTSHLSVVDASGMAVACTETINLVFGSLVCVSEFGFALNDEMDDFTTIPGAPNAFGLRQSDRNLPEPGKRPLSSMSPTIVLENGRVRLVAGASGGPRIITGTVQCVLNAMLFGMDPADAVAAPRFHHQWMPETLQLEDGWTNGDTIARLEERGHETSRRDEIGVVQMIRVDSDGLRAASDPRKGGLPAGY